MYLCVQTTSIQQNEKKNPHYLHWNAPSIASGFNTQPIIESPRGCARCPGYFLMKKRCKPFPLWISKRCLFLFMWNSPGKNRWLSMRKFWILSLGLLSIWIVHVLHLQVCFVKLVQFGLQDKDNFCSVHNRDVHWLQYKDFNSRPCIG